MFMLILTTFWHVHPYWWDPQGYVSLLHPFQSQNWQVRDPGCYCLFFISGLHPVSVTLCSYLIHRRADRNATTFLLPSPRRLPADVSHLPVPSAQHPWAEQDCCPQRAAASRKRTYGGLQSPKLVPKGIYFRQTIWCKDVLNSSGYCL